MKTATVGTFVFIILMIGLIMRTTQADSPISESALKDASATDLFIKLANEHYADSSRILKQLDSSWNSSYNAMALEVIRFSGSSVKQELLSIMQEKNPEVNLRDWKSSMQWLWNQPDTSTPQYARFKSHFYRTIDSKFANYFHPDRKKQIRLDEIVWGGVVQDGIPPLRSPKMIPAKDADYLNDSDVIFGIEINADARAYPKRILAWHEMFVDTVGGVPVAGVYCTLCGSAILYQTTVNGKNYTLGTSGFLYRSNKLMYDQATQSLWNTLKGEPVVGPLVDQGIVLPRGSIVTTDWKTWKARHPETSVLSLDTGHRRDYGEGVAYQNYFATDKLMFPVPQEDTRQKNKAEVLALLSENENKMPLAITANFLNNHPIHHLTWDNKRLVILTNNAGANRVYQIEEGLTFERWDKKNELTDSDGKQWTLTEDTITSTHDKSHKRFPAHRAFWFGWHAAFPDTKLIQ